jgi:DNA-binding CsgD family transcriptional regulator
MLKYELGLVDADEPIPVEAMDEFVEHVVATIKPDAAYLWTDHCGRTGYLIFDMTATAGWLMDAQASFEPRRLPAQPGLGALRDLGGSPTRPTAPTAWTGSSRGLTRREREVLLLVAEGMPNKVIAEKLFLSPRTVEKHVERLLTKTGTSNRAQLVSYSLRAAS